MINGYQCTIQVHVDDLKLSYVYQDELNKIIDMLNEAFGLDSDLLTASFGKIHKYLGMTIDWTTEGVVVFTMNNPLTTGVTSSPSKSAGASSRMSSK